MLSLFRDETNRRPTAAVAKQSTSTNHEVPFVTTTQNPPGQSQIYINSDERDFVTIEAADVGTFKCFDFLSVNVVAGCGTGIAPKLIVYTLKSLALYGMAYRKRSPVTLGSGGERNYQKHNNLLMVTEWKNRDSFQKFRQRSIPKA
jgi:hypothetical protein